MCAFTRSIVAFSNEADSSRVEDARTRGVITRLLHAALMIGIKWRWDEIFGSLSRTYRHDAVDNVSIPNLHRTVTIVESLSVTGGRVYQTWRQSRYRAHNGKFTLTAVPSWFPVTWLNHLISDALPPTNRNLNVRIVIVACVTWPREPTLSFNLGIYALKCTLRRRTNRHHRNDI